MKRKIKDGEFRIKGAGDIPVILMLVILMLCSCANEKKFVRFHDKQPEISNGHCRVWNPTKDSVHESVTYLPGKTDTVPGEIKYADCAEWVQQKLDAASKSGLVKNQELTRLKGIITSLNGKKLPVPCPPSTITHDTVDRVTYVQVRDETLENQLKKKVDQLQTKSDKYFKWAKYEGITLCILLLLIGTYVFSKISKEINGSK